MKVAGLLSLAAVARLVSGHAYVWGVWVNGVDQGRGDVAGGYIRKIASNSPVLDVKSADMTCNINSGANSGAVNVKSGDKITVEWAHDNRGDDIIASSHHGPVQVYIAPTASNGNGNVWVKLAQNGYANGVWAVDNLITNKGKHEFVMPDVAAGEYLIRPEIIALHEGDRLGGAQFYMSCLQFKVTSSSAKTLPAGIAIPGAYSATDPGILFNIYQSPMPAYQIPGGPIWDGSTGSAAAPAPVSSSTLPISSAAPASSSVSALSTAKPSLSSAGPASSSILAVSSAKSVTSKPVPTTFVTAVSAPTIKSTPTPTPSALAGGATAAQYAQCGGKNWTGATACTVGTTCKVFNEWYSQCV